ncbi:VWA domain-containing protein [Pseudomonas rubra]|uniref:VWA domain-containing protein n=1 Tax=Pseudomonas rubra TaxID=2942627 RepID=A0ABT5P6K2_9PSED|nr:VWA domain-containing protein [Pseudomonas rubra]MDD1013898.1 VWA domain-containing protein [Pseudomonas rubra]MDD1038281.1 VWA domain-containing protein [Pseudomonas rubra]MDD1154629.1 VWA domain-containing protein [Pseudomonas rubra]
MDIDLSAVHFLRPWWLLLLLPGVLLPLAWLRRHDLKRQLTGIIAPHLVEHLVIRPEDTQRLRPAHLLGAVLVIGGLAAAGPTWTQDLPDFVDNRAALILAVDLSPSMDADDVPPSRLTAVRHTLHDLVQRRAGARTALIAYAGSAHLVLPATDDPDLLDTFIQALSTDLIAQPGKDVLAVVGIARKLLEAENTPGTLVLLTDGADPGQFDALGQRLTDSDLQVLVLAVGSQDTGVLHDAKGMPRLDTEGRPVQGRFDAGALKGLAAASDAPLGSLTLNDDDLDWIELHAQQHFQAAQGDGASVHWKDAGYWLCWPLVLLALYCVRRGWRVNWLAGVLAVTLLGSLPAPARASSLADAFFTADQQGRWAFEQGRYGQAAARFEDPYWKGVAAYQASDYPLALASLARLDTASAWFYQGNSYVRLFKFTQAISAYRQALRLQPQFAEATANLALAQALLKDYQAQQQDNPELKPDKVIEDQTPVEGGKSQAQPTPVAASDQVWLENLGTSPAQFLKRKFQLQQAGEGQR